MLRLPSGRQTSRRRGRDAGRLASRDHAVRAKGESEQAFAAGTVVIGRERFDALWWAYLRARRRQPPRPRPAAALSDLAHGLRGDLPGGPRCAIVGVMTVDEPVELVAYDAAWPGRFARERRRLRTRIKRVARIEHIGSTAVPGLASKPIIDIMIGLDPADVDVVAEQIAAAGYTDLGEAGVPGRRHLRRRTPSATTSTWSSSADSCGATTSLCGTTCADTRRKPRATPTPSDR